MWSNSIFGLLFFTSRTCGLSTMDDAVPDEGLDGAVPMPLKKAPRKGKAPKLAPKPGLTIAASRPRRQPK